MADDPAREHIGQAKLIEQKGGMGSDDSSAESELIEQKGGMGSDDSSAESELIEQKGGMGSDDSSAESEVSELPDPELYIRSGRSSPMFELIEQKGEMGSDDSSAESEMSDPELSDNATAKPKRSRKRKGGKWSDDSTSSSDTMSDPELSDYAKPKRPRKRKGGKWSDDSTSSSDTMSDPELSDYAKPKRPRKSIEQKGDKRSYDLTKTLAGPSKMSDPELSDYAKPKRPRKSIEQKGDKRSYDLTKTLAGPSKMIRLPRSRKRRLQSLKLIEQKGGESSDDSTTKYAGPSKSNELDGVLLQTQRLTVCDIDDDTPKRLRRKVEKYGRDTVLKGGAGLELHVTEWMSTDDETLLELRDVVCLPDLIPILAPLCPAVKHISIDFRTIRLLPFTLMPMSIIEVCIKTLYCRRTLHEVLLAVSESFPNAEIMQVMQSYLSFNAYTPANEVNSSSPLSKLTLTYIHRFSPDVYTDSLFLDISTSCPNIVSLVLSGFGRCLTHKSREDITSCKFRNLTTVHLEPFGTDDYCRFEILMNVLHVVTSPYLKLVHAKKVQVGDAELTSVKWSKTSSSYELRLEGASAAVPMADLMHLVSNELEGVTVLTFDRCKFDITQNTSHPSQSTGKKSSLRELRLLNVENPLSKTDIHKLSEMYPNVKVTGEDESQASHEDSEQDIFQEDEEEKEEEEEEEKEEDYVAMENLLHETVPGEENVKPIKMECRERVGLEGGKLQLDSFGIELEIPLGAIDSEVPRDISLRVLTDTPNLGNSREEMSVCFGVQCLAPDDLVLKLPVTYTIPHCAVITRYSSVKAVLYTGEGEYSPDAVVKERIILSRSGIPSCIIRKDVLKLKMNHFSWAKIKLMFKNFFFRGKKMCCRPFKEKNLALQKTPVILHAHLYDDIKGNSELVKSQEKEEEFIPAHMEQQVLIQTSSVDLEMACYVKKTVIGGPIVVSYDKLMSGTRICEPFELDFPNQSDSVAVSLKVGQNKKLEVNLLFRLEDRGEKASQQDQEQLQGASSSQTLQTSPRSTGKTLENISDREEDFDDNLIIVARKVARREEIDNLGKALGFEPEDIQRYVNTNLKNPDVSYMGTLSMLRDWRKKQIRATECEALEGVLIKVDQNRLANELFGAS